MSLGKAFPEQLRDESTERQIRIGSVFRIFAPYTTPPKEKWHCIIGINDGKVGVLIINTVPYYIGPPTPELRALHHKFVKAPPDRDFFERDCHIDCSKIWEWDKDVLTAHLKENPSEHKGHLCSSDWQIVFGLAKSARTIPVKLKKKYRFFM